MERIGVYGGTFNPVHNGHLHVMHEFIKRLGLSKILMIPTYKPPHKAEAQLACSDDRMNMCRLAAKGDELLEISDIEIRRGGKSYTAETLSELKKEYPNSQLFLLMGEDMFVTLSHWRYPELIFKNAVIAAAPRSKDGLEKLEAMRRELEREYDARILFESISFLDISSTEIRRRIKAGENTGDMLPKSVENYILTHKIYEGTKT